MQLPPIPNAAAPAADLRAVAPAAVVPTAFSSRLFAVGMAVFLCACEGVQSALAPRGPQAQAIADISWIMFGGAFVILMLVMALALVAVLRAPEKRRPRSSNAIIAIGGVAFPVITLSALLLYGVHAMGNLRIDAQAAAVRIEVVGNRWWWDVHYLDAAGQRMASTANEIRIPAGVPVAVTVATSDVIHSFWVPNLAGKIDLIPGRNNPITLQADQPGRFRGHCAEFCGAQHARMAFFVIAETPADYAAWLERQRAPAAVPVDAQALRGRDAFIANGCFACHAVRGAGHTVLQKGPDLTHVGSREFIGAGTLPNSRANLAAFIAQGQRIKPGNAMPSFAHLDADTVQAIAAYLEGLR